MRNRPSDVDPLSAGGALLGLIAAFLTWTRFEQGPMQVALNGFRTSILGDAFFLASAGTLFVVLSHRGLLEIELPAPVHARATAVAAAVAAASVALQLVAVLLGGHRLAPGIGVALVAAALMAWAAWWRVTAPRESAVPEIIRDYGRR